MIRIVLTLMGVLVVVGAGWWFAANSGDDEPKKSARIEIKPAQKSEGVSVTLGQTKDQTLTKKSKTLDDKTKARLERLRKLAESAPIQKPEFDTDKFDGFDPDNSFEDGELVVVDPPANFRTVAPQLGYTILERVIFNDLELEVLRVKVPVGQSVKSGLRGLARRFPGLLVDANHQFDDSAR